METTRRRDALGLACLLFAVVGWGSNWPPLKQLLAELPPMSARAAAGLTGAALLAAAVALRGGSLRVPRALWGRLWLAGLLNVTSWMGFATLSLGWLTAGEGIIVAYTVPVWGALLAWPVLGERPSVRALIGLAASLGGVAVVAAGKGLDIGLAKLPGVGFALLGSVLFALGTVTTKRWPVALPGPVSAAWQVGLGMLPLLAAALLFESPDWAALSVAGWARLGYMAVIALCLCYLAWFTALKRLPASLCTQASLLSPIIGVAGAALLLGEPFGLREVAALVLVMGGVVLAVRG